MEAPKLLTDKTISGNNLPRILYFLETERIGNLVPDFQNAEIFHKQSRVEISYLTVHQKEDLQNDLSLFMEYFDNIEFDLDYEKKLIEKLSDELDLFSESLNSCAHETFFIEIKEHMNYNLDLFKRITTNTRKRRQTDPATNSIPRKDRARIMSLYESYSKLKNTELPQTERQTALDNIYEQLLSPRKIAKKESVLKFLEAIKIINVNVRLTRPGLVERFVQTIDRRYNLVPTNYNKVVLRPRTPLRPPNNVLEDETDSECDELSQIDAAPDASVKVLQISKDLGGEFYVLKFIHWPDSELDAPDTLIERFKQETKDLINEKNCDFTGRECNRFLPDPDKYLKVEQFKVDGQDDIMDKKLVSIVLEVRKKCLDRILSQHEKSILSLETRVSQIRNMIIQNNNALSLILGRTRAQAIFTDFDDDENFDDVASLFSLNPQEIESGLIETRLQRITEKVERRTQQTLLLEFKQLYEELEQQIGVLKSSHLPTTEIEKKFINLKGEISQEISNLANKVQTQFEQIRIKRNDINNDISQNARASDEGKYTTNDELKQLGLYFFKFSFQATVKKINGLIDAENMLRSGKATNEEIYKIGKACNLEMVSIQPTSSPSIYHALHTPSVFYKLKPIVLTVEGVQFSLEKTTNYGYKKEAEYCREEDIEFRQKTNHYICKETSTYEHPCTYATLSNPKDNCEFQVERAREGKEGLNIIFGFAHGSKYFLVETVKRMKIGKISGNQILKIYQYFLSIPTILHEFEAVEIKENYSLESLHDEIFRSREILLGLLIAIITNFVFFVALLIKKCCRFLKNCFNFVISATTSNEDSVEEIRMTSRPSVRFQAVRA